MHCSFLRAFKPPSIPHFAVMTASRKSTDWISTQHCYFSTLGSHSCDPQLWKAASAPLTFFKSAVTSTNEPQCSGNAAGVGTLKTEGAQDRMKMLWLPAAEAARQNLLICQCSLPELKFLTETAKSFWWKFDGYPNLPNFLMQLKFVHLFLV